VPACFCARHVPELQTTCNSDHQAIDCFVQAFMRTNIGYDQLKNLIVNALRHDKAGAFSTECVFLLFDMVCVSLVYEELARVCSRETDWQIACNHHGLCSWLMEASICTQITPFKMPTLSRCCSTYCRTCSSPDSCNSWTTLRSWLKRAH
jgi:hypothetical protein